jgi:hypothetical protein
VVTPPAGVHGCRGGSSWKSGHPWKIVKVPQPCPACFHSHLRAIDVALLCGESFYSIGKRFGLSAMAASRHWDRCCGVDHRLRGMAQEYGANVIRRALLNAAPYAAAEIKAWLRGDRPQMPTKEWPELKHLKRLSRQMAALKASI